MKTPTPPFAKKTAILDRSAVMTRFAEERGHSGALQRLQRGSRSSGTTQPRQ